MALSVENWWAREGADSSSSTPRITNGSAPRWRRRDSRKCASGSTSKERRALSELDNPFFVLYGDSYLECDYAAIEKVFLSSGKRGLMTVYRNDDRQDRSNVLYVAGRIIRYDKQRRAPEMRHIDYGLGALW